MGKSKAPKTLSTAVTVTANKKNNVIIRKSEEAAASARQAQAQYKAKRGEKGRKERRDRARSDFVSVWQVDLMHLKAFPAHQWLIRNSRLSVLHSELCWMNRNTTSFLEEFMSSLFYADEIALNAVRRTVCVCRHEKVIKCARRP